MRDPGSDPPYRGSLPLLRWLLPRSLFDWVTFLVAATVTLALSSDYGIFSAVVFLSRHVGTAIRAGALLWTRVLQHAPQDFHWHNNSIGWLQLLGLGQMLIYMSCALQVVLSYLPTLISLATPLFQSAGRGFLHFSFPLVVKLFQFASSGISFNNPLDFFLILSGFHGGNAWEHCGWCLHILGHSRIQVCDTRSALRLNILCYTLSTVCLATQTLFTMRMLGTFYFSHCLHQSFTMSVGLPCLLATPPIILVLSIALSSSININRYVLLCTCCRLADVPDDMDKLPKQAHDTQSQANGDNDGVHTYLDSNDNNSPTVTDYDTDDEHNQAGMDFPSPVSSASTPDRKHRGGLTKPSRPLHGLLGGASDGAAMTSESVRLDPSPYQVDTKSTQRLRTMTGRADSCNNEDTNKRNSDFLEAVVASLNDRMNASISAAKVNTFFPQDDRDATATACELKHLDAVLNIVFSFEKPVALASLQSALHNNSIFVLPGGRTQIRTGTGDAFCKCQQHILCIDNSGSTQSAHLNLAKLLLGRLDIQVEGQPFHAHIYGGEMCSSTGIKEIRISINNQSSNLEVFNQVSSNEEVPDAKCLLLIALCALSLPLPLVHEILLSLFRRAGIMADFIRMDTMHNVDNPRTGRKTLWKNNNLYDSNCGIVLQFISPAQYNRALSSLTNSDGGLNIPLLPDMSCLGGTGLGATQSIKVTAFRQSSTRSAAPSRSSALNQQEGNITTTLNTLWAYWILESCNTDDNSASSEMTATYLKMLRYITQLLSRGTPSSDTGDKRSFRQKVSYAAPRMAAALNQLDCGRVMNIELSFQKDNLAGPFSQPLLAGLCITLDSNSNASKMVNMIHNRDVSFLIQLASILAANGGADTPDTIITDYLREGPGKVRVCAKLMADCPPKTTSKTPPLPQALAPAPQSNSQGRHAARKPSKRQRQTSYADAARQSNTAASEVASQPGSNPGPGRNFTARDVTAWRQASRDMPTIPEENTNVNGASVSSPPLPQSSTSPSNHPVSAAPGNYPGNHVPIQTPLNSTNLNSWQISELVGSQCTAQIQAAMANVQPLIDAAVNNSKRELEESMTNELTHVREDIDEIHLRLNSHTNDLTKLSSEMNETILNFKDSVSTQLAEVLSRLPPLPTQHGMQLRSRSLSQPPADVRSGPGPPIFSRNTSPVVNHGDVHTPNDQ